MCVDRMWKPLGGYCCGQKQSKTRGKMVFFVLCVCFCQSLIPFLSYVLNLDFLPYMRQRQGVVCVEKFATLLVVVLTCDPSSLYVFVVSVSVVLCV